MYQKQIRRLSEYEIPVALDLAWRVFSEYESPDYSDEGTEEFRRCLHDEEYLYGIDYIGAFYDQKLIGLIGIRTELEHICFFFVDGQYHRKGVGTKMFSTMKVQLSESELSTAALVYIIRDTVGLAQKIFGS